MKHIELDDIVRVMERGQITIPVKMREELNLAKGTKLSIKVTYGNRLIIEPLFTQRVQRLHEVLEKAAHDKTIYWTKADDARLQRIRKASKKRLQSLKW